MSVYFEFGSLLCSKARLCDFFKCTTLFLASLQFFLSDFSLVELELILKVDKEDRINFSLAQHISRDFISSFWHSSFHCSLKWSILSGVLLYFISINMSMFLSNVRNFSVYLSALHCNSSLSCINLYLQCFNRTSYSCFVSSWRCFGTKFLGIVIYFAHSIHHKVWQGFCSSVCNDNNCSCIYTVDIFIVGALFEVCRN